MGEGRAGYSYEGLNETIYVGIQRNWEFIYKFRGRLRMVRLFGFIRPLRRGAVICPDATRRRRTSDMTREDRILLISRTIKPSI